MSKLCENCKLRKRYDKDQRSFLGRFWRWHINFCPGWMAYYKSLDEAQRQNIKELYGFER
ncbi:MAG: hypothetical protein SNG02_03985 [Rikenellaceae bacterium]